MVAIKIWRALEGPEGTESTESTESTEELESTGEHGSSGSELGDWEVQEALAINDARVMN